MKDIYKKIALLEHNAKYEEATAIRISILREEHQGYRVALDALLGIEDLQFTDNMRTVVTELRMRLSSVETILRDTYQIEIE